MAKKNGNGVGPKGSGWNQVKPTESRVWFVVGPGNTIQGRLLGRAMRRKTNDGKPSAFYQVELTEKCDTCITGRGKDQKEVIADVGTVVNVGERADLMDLAPLAEKKGEYEVFIACQEKLKIEGGQTMWKFETMARALTQST